MKVGYHLANDGNITDDHLQLLRKADTPIVKVLLRLDLQYEPTDFRRLHEFLPAHTEIVIRLYMPGQARWTPYEFAGRATGKLQSVLPLIPNRRTWIEIHNEPNHPEEGWGPSIDNTLRFGNWFHGVFTMLRQARFQNLGFPGLAVGEWRHKERSWGDTLLGVMKEADWVGCHCYWQSPNTLDQLTDPRLGKNWSWYLKRIDRPIIITEAGNSNAHGGFPVLSPYEQSWQYGFWCETVDPRIYAVNFFMLGGTEDWAGFRVYDETVLSLKGEVMPKSSNPIHKEV